LDLEIWEKAYTALTKDGSHRSLTTEQAIELIADSFIEEGVVVRFDWRTVIAELSRRLPSVPVNEMLFRLANWTGRSLGYCYLLEFCGARDGRPKRSSEIASEWYQCRFSVIEELCRSFEIFWTPLEEEHSYDS
jgi:hypothetical protein